METVSPKTIIKRLYFLILVTGFFFIYIQGYAIDKHVPHLYFSSVLPLGDTIAAETGAGAQSAAKNNCLVLVTMSCIGPTGLRVIITNTTCQKNNGAIAVSFSAGTAPYTFSLNGNTQNNGYFSRLDSGTYTIVVKDANGILTDTTVTLINSSYPPQLGFSIKAYPSYCNASDGTIVLSATGGTSPYSYSMDNIGFQSSDTFNNIAKGAYIFLLKDANGCESANNPLVVVGVAGCFLNLGGSWSGSTCGDGYIDAEVEGVANASQYSYSSDGINYQASPDFFNLSPMLHRIYTKDPDGNISVATFSMYSNCSFYFLNDVSAASCQQNDGSIAITSFFNGTPPYSYTIDGINFQSDSIFSQLAPGNYNVGVKDVNGNIASKAVIVPLNCIPAITSLSVPDTCKTGKGSIIVTGYGTKPYQYSIDGIHFKTDSLFGGLTANNYTVYFKDANNNELSTTVVVNNICLQAMAVSSNESCGNKNGSIIVTSSGGTQPYLYSIDGINFQSNNIFTGLDSGAYTVTIRDASGLNSNTIVSILNIPAVVLNLGKDTALCSGQTLILSAYIPGNNVLYNWQDGSTNSTYVVLNEGQYWATATINGCSSTDTLQVTYKPMPLIYLGDDTTLCDGATKQLDATNSNATYEWQDGSIDSTYLVQNAGLYYVTVDLNNCKVHDSININYLPTPVFNLGIDTSICKGESITLAPQLNTSVNYLWQDGSRNSSFIVKDAGMYKLTTFNQCGTFTNSITINDRVCDLYIPSAFTPNNDGKDDVFEIKYPFATNEFDMMIFNRWGQKLFESNDMAKGWNGTFEGQNQYTGTYVWIISLTTMDNVKKVVKGTVTLIR